MKRGRLLVALVALLTMARFIAPAPAQAAGAAPFIFGSGAASAGVTKARLFYAGYALSVPLGLAATSYENKQSRALGGAYDLSAVLGLVGKTSPLASFAIDSNKGDKTQSTNAGADSAGHVLLSAKAIPSSHSDVHLADVDLPGLVQVKGGRAQFVSEVVGGKQRVATSTVTVASLSLAGGLVALEGLRWDATHQSGATKVTASTFTLGALKIAGVPVKMDSHNLDAVLATVNKALATTGVVIEAPKVVKHENGAADISGLRVGIIHSPIGAKVLGPLIAQLRPSLLPAFEALAGANSTLGLAGLVSDLGFGVVDGSGGLELSIGGATALTTDTVFSNPLGGDQLGQPALTPGVISTSPDFVGLPPLIANPGTPGGSKELLSAARPARCILAADAREGDCRGTNVPGAIAVVGLVVAALATYENIARRRRIA